MEEKKKHAKDLLRFSKDLIANEDEEDVKLLYLKIFISLSKIIGKQLANEAIEELRKEI